MYEWVRHCIGCKREIRACNGYVIARDIVDAFIEGTRAPEQIRELCGLCGMALTTKPSGEERSYEEYMEALEGILNENPFPLPRELREIPTAA